MGAAALQRAYVILTTLSFLRPTRSPCPPMYSHRFPMQQFAKAWQRGHASAFVPKKYGGAGMSMNSTHEVKHQLQSVDKVMQPILAAHYKAQIALQFSEKQQQQHQYFSLLSQSPTLAGSVITSSLKPFTSEATFRRAGDDYLLNGTSIPYTNASVASFYVVEAVPEGANAGSNDQMVFIVDKHRLGICVEAPDGSMTLDEASHTRKVSFYNVRVTSEAVLGKGKELSSLMAAMLEEVM